MRWWRRHTRWGSRSSVIEGERYCDFGFGQIGIRPDVDGLQAVKTLVHELAHALLHRDRHGLSRDVAEVEVESVAFIVLDTVGLASDD